MKKIFLALNFIMFIFVSSAQCDPAAVGHYNMGDFPFTSSTGVTVSMAGTNSGTLGPYGQYGCSPALCEANTIRLDPGDDLIFNFSQAVYELTFVAGVMNPTENGVITSDNGVPTLTTNCVTDLQITGNAFEQIGALASPLITVSVPGGATSITISCLGGGSTNGVFTVDMLDCINLAPPCVNTSNSITETACDNYVSPSTNYTWTSSNTYLDTIPNAAGCDSVITIDLTINNSTTSNVNETGMDSLVYNGQTYYQSGVYTQVIQNNAGCDSTITLDVSLEFTGLSELSSTQLLIYPNPSSENITLKGLDNLLDPREIEIISMEGRQVYLSQKVSEIIDVSNFATGTYLVKLKHTSGVEIMRFVKP